MQLLSRLRMPLNISVEEKKRISLLFWHSFILGIATSFFFVASNSFFIRNVALSNIPLAYIAAGVCGLFMVSGYKSYQSRFGILSSYRLTLIVFAVIAAVLYFLHSMSLGDGLQKTLLSYSAFVLIYPFSVLFVIGFSGIGLSLFNIAQSKRFTALIGTGEVIASIIGYIIVPFITKIVGNTEILFLLSGIVLLCSILPLQRLKSEAGEAMNKTRAAIKVNISVLTKDEFYRLIGLFTFFSVVAVYLSDYAYLLATRQLAAITEIEVAVIIAMLFTVIKLGELTFSFLSGSIITARGMHFALILLPVLLTVVVVCALLSEFIFTEYALFLIIFFLLNKWNERVVRKGITAPALKVLYQVTKPSERAQIQTLLEGLINQVATIVVGILLFLLTSFLADSTDPIAFFKAAIYVSLILLAGWLVITNKLYHTYKRRVQEFLHSLKTTETQPEVAPLAIIADAEVSQRVQQINKMLTENDSQSLLLLLSNYHPALRGMKPKDILPFRLSKMYFQEDYFFSRWLLVKYLYQLPLNERTALVLEWFDISNLELRKGLLDALNAGTDEVPVQVQQFFGNRIEDVVKEIAWAEAAIHDSEGENNTGFIKLFEQYRDAQTAHLLQMMKLVFDAAAISTIEEIVSQKEQDEESHLFVVELLENLLPAEQKSLIVPVFEQGAFGRKKARWSEHFYLYSTSAQERIKEYLLRDYKLVLPWSKYHALEMYHTAFGEAALIKAFAANKIHYLSEKAANILNDSRVTDAYIRKEQAIAEINAQISEQRLKNCFLLESTELYVHGRKMESQYAFKENMYWQKHSGQNGSVYLDLIAMAIAGR